jgi:hypothetical protein
MMKPEHPTLEEILSVLDGRRTGPARMHVESGCTMCREVADRYRPLLRSLAQDRLDEAPAAWKRRALAAIAAERRREAGRAVVRTVSAAISRIASLVVDSGAAPALAGVRAGAPAGAVAPVRHLIFESETNRFTLRVERSTEGTFYDIRGQILLTQGAADAVPVTLRPQKGRARTTRSETTGEFVFERVHPGRYALVVDAAGGSVTLPGIDLA